ncbi:hypothetical protein M231_01300 [Tremella mesenterica]|uniref:Uncharacterized protein n=1 Tax=Tremella mesenterica TaxID=5217 RepID=A0A4Q1BTN8_TREME|nr:hypothetical protein M231_01300 [Tremella mesenterica]
MPQINSDTPDPDIQVVVQEMSHTAHDIAALTDSEMNRTQQPPDPTDTTIPLASSRMFLSLFAPNVSHEMWNHADHTLQEFVSVGAWTGSRLPALCQANEVMEQIHTKATELISITERDLSSHVGQSYQGLDIGPLSCEEGYVGVCTVGNHLYRLIYVIGEGDELPRCTVSVQTISNREEIYSQIKHSQVVLSRYGKRALEDTLMRLSGSERNLEK